MDFEIIYENEKKQYSMNEFIYECIKNEIGKIFNLNMNNFNMCYNSKDNLLRKYEQNLNFLKLNIRCLTIVQKKENKDVNELNESDINDKQSMKLNNEQQKEEIDFINDIELKKNKCIKDFEKEQIKYKTFIEEIQKNKQILIKDIKYEEDKLKKIKEEIENNLKNYENEIKKINDKKKIKTEVSCLLIEEKRYELLLNSKKTHLSRIESKIHDNTLAMNNLIKEIDDKTSNKNILEKEIYKIENDIIKKNNELKKKEEEFKNLEQICDLELKKKC